MAQQLTDAKSSEDVAKDKQKNVTWIFLSVLSVIALLAAFGSKK